MMITGGRIVVVSAAVVGSALTGLLLFPLYFLRSLAWAGLAVVALAAVVALLVVPAALSCLGERRAGADWFARRRMRGPVERGRWYRLAAAVMRRPVLVGVGGLLVLTALAVPFRGAVFGLSDERVLPRTAPVASAARALRADLPAVASSPSTSCCRTGRPTPHCAAMNWAPTHVTCPPCRGQRVCGPSPASTLPGVLS